MSDGISNCCLESTFLDCLPITSANNGFSELLITEFKKINIGGIDVQTAHDNGRNANFSISEDIQLINTLYFQLSTIEARDYRLLFESMLDYKLNDNLEFSFELNYRFDNQPHGDLGKNYYDVKNGITYRF